MKIKNLNLTHKKDLRVILSGFNLVLNKGDKAVIIGEEGNGKSTLLNNITDASPKVANYPFTTQGLQIGNYEMLYRQYQIIDTPGLLNRNNLIYFLDKKTTTKETKKKYCT